jgi:ubiquitin C-terminal hydrolase
MSYIITMNDAKSLEGKGRNGLYNVGSTCYVNTSIQCLGHCMPFLKFVLYDPRHIIEGSLVYELNDVLKELWIKDNGVIPNRFLKQLRAHMGDLINVFEQNDIHEFLTLFIDKMNRGISGTLDTDALLARIKYDDTSYDKLRRKMDKSWFMNVGREYSPLIDMFYGQSVVQIVCGNCDKIHHVYEPFAILPIPIPTAPADLMECINHYCTEEYLNDGHSEWKCDGCKQQSKSLKTMKFWRLPKVLMICLKRFTEDLRKNNTPIVIKEQIDLSDVTIGPTRSKYRIKAVGCHTGNFHSGHYYAICQNPDGRWYRIDDTTVSEAGKNESPSNAYMLFYEIIE